MDVWEAFVISARRERRTLSRGLFFARRAALSSVWMRVFGSVGVGAAGVPESRRMGVAMKVRRRAGWNWEGKKRGRPRRKRDIVAVDWGFGRPWESLSARDGGVEVTRESR